MNATLNASTIKGRTLTKPSQWSILAFCVVYLSVASVSVQAQPPIDYTCDPRMDYPPPNGEKAGSCPEANIQDGVCDNPNHGGALDECLEQDCIDCNFHCRSFDADCFGCLNAKGCYYCPGDATCQNSDLYSSSNKELSCTKSEDFWLGGRDDPDQLCISTDSLTSDPLALANDWAYKMINVDQVWSDGITGKGISIRINDDGVDIDNQEFDGRFDEANSCDRFRPTAGDDDGHGTKVAGIVAGNANNVHCAAGIAYDSTFSACNAFVGGISFQNLNSKLESFDISQNSIGQPACAPGEEVEGLQACPFTVPNGAIYDPCDQDKCDFSTTVDAVCENEIFKYCKENYRDDEAACLDFLDVLLLGGTCDYDKLPQSAIDALANGVINGRDGKGVIYVFASGNAFFEGEDINMSRWTNSRYTITVGAVGKDGKHSDYSTPGSALYIVAPAGDYADAGHIMTAGLGGTCTDSGPGTSFSAPVVSGVVALMLQARPELTWRDVQGILAVTSQKVTDPKDKTMTTNAAGFTHSNWYGFGIVDAKKAVEKAKAWDPWTPEYQAIGESEEENAVIPNDGKRYISDLTISSDYKGFKAESSVVLVNLQHYNRGDLELTLVSPSGTESILHPGKRPESNQLEGDERWKLMTVRNWGEDPTGKWKLKVKDLVTSNDGTTNEFRQWKLVVYGRTADGLPPVLTGNTTTEAPTLVPLSSAPSFVATPESTDSNSTDDIIVDNEDVFDDDIGSSAPTKAPVEPTIPPTFSPTRVPLVRPTTLVRNPNEPQPPTLTARGPGTVTVTTNDNQQVTLPGDFPVPVRAPPPGLNGLLGGKVNRPTYITRQSPEVSTIPGAQGVTTASAGSPLTSRLRSFGADESEEEAIPHFRSENLVQNLSLKLEGVSKKIPKRLWPSLQTALEEHTNSVVATALPELNFHSEIQLVSVILNEIEPNRQRLVPGDEVPSVTIVYDELVHYSHLPGVENLSAAELAGLAFEDPDDRQAFVANIQREFDKSKSGLSTLESVSTLGLSPATTPAAKPADIFPSEEAGVPINGFKSRNQVNEPYNDPISDNSTIIVWSVIGFGILCSTVLMVMVRRKRVVSYGKLSNDI